MPLPFLLEYFFKKEFQLCHFLNVIWIYIYILLYAWSFTQRENLFWEQEISED